MKVKTALKKLNALPGVTVEVKERRAKVSNPLNMAGSLMYTEVSAVWGKFKLTFIDWNDGKGLDRMRMYRLLSDGTWKLHMSGFDNGTDAVTHFADYVTADS